VRIKKKNEERITELMRKGRVHRLFGSEVTEVLGRPLRRGVIGAAGVTFGSIGRLGGFRT